MAWESGVEELTSFNATENLFSSGELTVLSLSGQGTVFLASCGALCERTVEPADPLVADEDHIVAWTDGLDLSRQKDGDLKSTVFGGEGLVTEFTGRGRVWLQTRNPMLSQRSQQGGQQESTEPESLLSTML